MAGSLLKNLSRIARSAIRQALEVDGDPDVRETTDSRFGDYQINGVLPLAKVLKANPRQLAERVVECLDTEGIFEAPEIAGPGFINLRLKADWVGSIMGRVAMDDRVGVQTVDKAESVVVDFSSPNVAKRMHVGHLRSTIIGDAICRTLRFLGHEVVGDNHVGDWGTQFGILIWAWRRHSDETRLAEDPIGELERLYKLGSEASRGDEAVAEACRAELVKLQKGDEENHVLWQRFVDISRQDAEKTYARLGVSFDTWLGESFYHPRLADVVSRLQKEGIARESEGAIAVFFGDDTKLKDKPLLIQKSDGAYLYATTDIATLDHRKEAHHADRVVYVVDSRQSLHFQQLFQVAGMLSYDVHLEHVGFGMMLGADGRPFRTRDGGTVTLNTLLDEAEERILPIVQEKWPDAAESDQREIASQVGIGAVKYADLSPNLATDYRFDWDKLLAADGNTGPYLLYTLVRIRSVFREYTSRFGDTFAPEGQAVTLDDPEALALAKQLLKFQDVLYKVGDTLRPHFLCEYLYELTRAFNLFYAKRKILGAETDALRRDRVTLAFSTARVLEIGFGCLNLPNVERM